MFYFCCFVVLVIAFVVLMTRMIIIVAETVEQSLKATNEVVRRSRTARQPEIIESTRMDSGNQSRAELRAGSQRWKIGNKLNGDNYLNWRNTMVRQMKEEEVIAAIETELAEEDPANRRVLAMISQSIETEFEELIELEPTAFHAWRVIVNRFEVTDYLKCEHLDNQLDLLKLMDTVEVEEHLKSMESIFRDMTRAGMVMKAGVKARKLAKSLVGEKFMNVKAFIYDLKDDVRDDRGRDIYEQARARLLYFCKNFGSSSGQGMAMQVGTQQTRRGGFRQANHRNQPRRFGGEILCALCSSSTHRVFLCPELEKAKEALNINKVSKQYPNRLRKTMDKWILDSGATRHYSNGRCKLRDVHPVSEVVTLADNHQSVVVAQAAADISDKLVLEDVRVVPEFNLNLASVPKLTEDGGVVVFDKEKAEVLGPDGAVVARASKDDNHLYVFSEQPTEFALAVSSTTTNPRINLLHEKLGHVGNDKLKILLSEKECAADLPNNCEVCNLTKLKQTSYPSSFSQAEEVGELIHVDACGPFATLPSFDQSKYFVVITDDKSRFTTVCLIKSRDVMPECIKNYVTWAERQTGANIKRIRTDNARELLSNDFQSYLLQHGIKHELSVPYAHPQNGRAERVIQSIEQVTRSLLEQAKLPMKYWPLAIRTAAYIINRVPHSSIENQIPAEVFLNENVDLREFHVFGSVAYVWIPRERRNSKLHPTSEKMIFVGYCNNQKALKFLDPHTQKVIEQCSYKIIDGKYYYGASGDGDVCPRGSAESVNEPLGGEVRQLRPREQIRQPDRLGMVCAVIDNDVPGTPEEALSHPLEGDAWSDAIADEYQSLVDHQVFELVEHTGQRLLDSRFVFARKRNKLGEVTRFKARLVVKGFKQIPGIDYSETYAPVGERVTLRILLTFAAKHNWPAHHFDVKTAFLHGELKEELYLKPPAPYNDNRTVWRLRKSLYGLKQAPHQWNEFISSNLEAMGFRSVEQDPCLFVKSNVFLLLYVDDALVVGKTQADIEAVAALLKSKMTIHDEGSVTRFLGINVSREGDKFHLDQSDYITKLSKLFHLEYTKPTKSPLPSGLSSDHTECIDKPSRSLIGSLMYIAVNTRPDIAAAVNLLARNVSQPTEGLWSNAKQILQFLISTQSKSLCLGEHTSTILDAYSDSDFANDASRKSQSGIIIRLYGSPVMWTSRRQEIIATSSCEAEYVALSQASRDVRFIQQMLQEMNLDYAGPTSLYVDNSSAIELAKGTTSRSKHIDIRYHFIRDLIRKNIITVRFVPSSEQIADVLTKTNPAQTFKVIHQQLHLTTRQGECQGGSLSVEGPSPCE